MSKIDPIVLVDKRFVTLMNRGHEEDEYAYACGKCGALLAKKEDAENHCQYMDSEIAFQAFSEVKDEADDL